MCTYNYSGKHEDMTKYKTQISVLLLVPDFAYCHAIKQVFWTYHPLFVKLANGIKYDDDEESAKIRSVSDYTNAEIKSLNVTPYFVYTFTTCIITFVSLI